MTFLTLSRRISLLHLQERTGYKGQVRKSDGNMVTTRGGLVVIGALKLYLDYINLFLS